MALFINVEFEVLHGGIQQLLLHAFSELTTLTFPGTMKWHGPHDRDLLVCTLRSMYHSNTENHIYLS